MKKMWFDINEKLEIIKSIDAGLLCTVPFRDKV